MPRPDLRVFLYGHHVADLIDADDGYTAIRYTDEAIAADDHARYRLSLSLPVRKELYPAMGLGGRWVRSLLPEGRALDWAVEQFGIPADDRYGLMEALGPDVAGAVQILGPNASPTSQGTYESLTPDELAQIVANAPRMGLGLDAQRGVRLSLAGLQDKVLLHRIGADYFRPTNGAPSSVIVKPEPSARPGRPDLTGLATNELFCLTLARLSGLDAAVATLERFGDTPALVVDRYDRVAVDGRIQRIHQEDLLSALGSDPLIKYEQPHAKRVPAGGFANEGLTLTRPGPSLRDLAELLSAHLGPANLSPFLEAVTFNIVIGNADSHARNYSVLLEPEGTVALAPLYDLISTRFYPELDADTPQKVNGVTQIDHVRATDIVSEAALWGVPDTVSERRVRSLVARVEGALSSARSECESRGGDPLIASQIAELISQRAKAFKS